MLLCTVFSLVSVLENESLQYREPTPVTVRSKAWVCVGSKAGIACTNPTQGMDVCLLRLLSCVGSGFCDELIPRSEESYRVCMCVRARARACLIVRRPRPELGCCATKKKTILRTHYPVKRWHIPAEWRTPQSLQHTSRCNTRYSTKTAA
jgi:hypothetical protein